ncbi:type II secretion system F family protein [Candidatus Pacearchaeota archaeon]|nr:type II secretion system F family protein [Candidatus Pacearchaeota archaeon]
MIIGKTHWIGIIFGIVILGVDFFLFFGENLFYFLIGIAVAVLALPFVMSTILETSQEKEKNEQFLEFARALAENVKGGTPISQSIKNMRSKNFGSLTDNIGKLANQIALGIPMSKALDTFAEDVGSLTVKRAISLIKEAEMAGGKIDNILDSVASSIYQIEKLKKERAATISNLVVQGYIIFFIFIGIMLVMQFKIIPLTEDVNSVGGLNIENPSEIGALGGVGSGTGASSDELSRPLLYMLLLQGIFSGLAIGKLSEGSIKAGIKHSFVMTVTAFLISTGAKAFL